MRVPFEPTAFPGTTNRRDVQVNNVYTHDLPASQRRAVERVSEVMFSIVLELGESEQEGKSK